MIPITKRISYVGQRHLNEKGTFELAEKLTFEYVYKFFNDQGCALISATYKSSKLNLAYTAQCGHINEISFDKFKNKGSGRLCSDCAQSKIQRSNRRRRLTLSDAKITFEKNGCTLLESEYISSKTKMRCICKCGEIKYLKYEQVAKGQHCRECSYKKTAETSLKYTLEDVKQIFEDANYQLLSAQYRSTNDRLKYMCDNGHIREATLSSFISGNRCRKCADIKYLTGENSPTWRADKTDEERIKQRKFKAYEDWRKLVFERDNYTCACCGQYGGGLAAHHLDGWHWCKERRLDVSNGVTLCNSCHDQFHIAHGKFNNTEVQFRKWIKSKVKQDA